MATEFDRFLSGYRWVETRWGDTLQAIAVRELGDAARWVDIANLNGLRPPYITGDPEVATGSVLLYGKSLLVPSSAPLVSESTDPAAVFGSDCLLVDGLLTEEDGDIVLVDGRGNLRQALSHRIKVAQRTLMFHLDYGSRLRTLVGSVDGATANALAAAFTRAALLADPRVKSIPNVVATITGDSISVVADVEPITGKVISLSEVV